MLGASAGIGFTDIMKRPTARAEDVRPDDCDFGRARLEKKLAEVRPRLVIFTFKRAAEKSFGDFSGNGFVRGLAMGSARVFVMPGPMEERQRAERTLRQLRRAVQAMRSGKQPAQAALVPG